MILSSPCNPRICIYSSMSGIGRCGIFCAWYHRLALLRNSASSAFNLVLTPLFPSRLEIVAWISSSVALFNALIKLQSPGGVVISQLILLLIISLIHPFRYSIKSNIDICFPSCPFSALSLFRPVLYPFSTAPPLFSSVSQLGGKMMSPFGTYSHFSSH